MQREREWGHFMDGRAVETPYSFTPAGQARADWEEEWKRFPKFHPETRELMEQINQAIAENDGIGGVTPEGEFGKLINTAVGEAIEEQFEIRPQSVLLRVAQDIHDALEKLPEGKQMTSGLNSTLQDVESLLKRIAPK